MWVSLQSKTLQKNKTNKNKTTSEVKGINDDGPDEEKLLLRVFVSNNVLSFIWLGGLRSAYGYMMRILK